MYLITTTLFVLGTALLGAGVVGVVLVMVRILPTVALINVKNIPVDKAARMKEQIIADRIVRTLQKHSAPVRTALTRVGALAQARFRRAARTAFNLERRSAAAAREGWDALTSGMRVQQLVREGDRITKEGNYGEAEKRYVQALAIDMKNPKVYEKLGNLYLRAKQYEQSRETLRFAARLSGNDASVLASLGEVASAEGQYSDAITYFQHAVSLRPRSPRYLDFLIEACIMGGNPACAKDTLNALAAVNPQNAKLSELHQRIREMRS